MHTCTACRGLCPLTNCTTLTPHQRACWPSSSLPSGRSSGLSLVQVSPPRREVQLCMLFVRWLIVACRLHDFTENMVSKLACDQKMLVMLLALHWVAAAANHIECGFACMACAQRCAAEPRYRSCSKHFLAGLKLPVVFFVTAVQ